MLFPSEILHNMEVLTLTMLLPYRVQQWREVSPLSDEKYSQQNLNRYITSSPVQKLGTLSSSIVSEAFIGRLIMTEGTKLGLVQGRKGLFEHYFTVSFGSFRRPVPRANREMNSFILNDRQRAEINSCGRHSTEFAQKRSNLKHQPWKQS